jgi:hypothetical protein
MLAGSIANAKLANSSITVNGSAISLGGSATITANTTNALTIGTGLSGTSFNGSSGVTIAIDSTVATLTGSQTLTNKTLTAPAIGSGGFTIAGSTSGTVTIVGQATASGTLTLPNGADTLVGRATTDTLTNKTLTSPTLTTPVLGTPSSGTLTNCTGLPVSTGISGLGTGVATALAVNVGSAGAFVTFNGALGTPSSGTLTNATGLPVSTGISGLGAGVATWLATPSSANLATAVTDETGSGSLVFATAPTFTTSIDGGATFGAFASSTTLTEGYTGTATSTHNIATGATASAATKTINLGTAGAAGSTTTITIGSTTGTSTTTVNQTFRATGEITAYYSDKRLKENIKPIENALAKTMALHGVTYNANEVAAEFGYTNKETQVGLLAQDVKAVLPEVVVPAPFDIKVVDGKEVSKSGEDYITIKYEKIVALLVEAIKELNDKVESLEAQLGGSKSL